MIERFAPPAGTDPAFVAKVEGLVAAATVEAREVLSIRPPKPKLRPPMTSRAGPAKPKTMLWHVRRAARLGITVEEVTC